MPYVRSFCYFLVKTPRSWLQPFRHNTLTSQTDDRQTTCHNSSRTLPCNWSVRLINEWINNARWLLSASISGSIISATVLRGNSSRSVEDFDISSCGPVNCPWSNVTNPNLDKPPDSMVWHLTYSNLYINSILCICYFHKQGRSQEFTTGDRNGVWGTEVPQRGPGEGLRWSPISWRQIWM